MRVYITVNWNKVSDCEYYSTNVVADEWDADGNEIPYFEVSKNTLSGGWDVSVWSEEQSKYVRTGKYNTLKQAKVACQQTTFFQMGEPITGGVK